MQAAESYSRTGRSLSSTAPLQRERLHMTAPARSSTTPSTSASMTLNDANYTPDNDNNDNNNNSNNSTGQKERLTRTVSLSINTDRESDKHRGRDRDRDGEGSNNINSNNNNNNDSNINSNMIELSIRPLSTYAVQAMNEVTDRFYSDSCEVQGLLESALGADPSNFKKVKRIFYVFSI